MKDAVLLPHPFHLNVVLFQNLKWVYSFHAARGRRRRTPIRPFGAYYPIGPTLGWREVTMFKLFAEEAIGILPHCLSYRRYVREL